MKWFFAFFTVFFLVFGCGQESENMEPVTHTFLYKSDSAKQVAVAGNFNNWSADAHPMKYMGEGVWKLEVQLPPNYYLYKLVVDGKWIPDPENDWKINDGGDSFNSIVKIGTPPVPKRKKNPIPFPKDRLPEPILENNPGYVDIYYAAWRMAWNKIQHGTPRNGFAQDYMDEGFNELIYQWDMCFITSFAIYARDIFPVMPSLDNFYDRQRDDGYIQRVYWETTGKSVQELTADEPMVNPPLFAWVEWRYYTISGDSSRLRRVLPILVNYYSWIENNCRTDKGKGLFYTTPLGSGMDNTPRNGVGKAAWIDFSAQQALAAHYISKIAAEINQQKLAEEFTQKHLNIKNLINNYLWDDQAKFYFDLTREGTLSNTMHIGAFWTLMSDVCPIDRLEYMLLHLTNPNTFWRPHLVPTLAANQPQYDPKGHYWLGGVWAPTNYMVVQGLKKYHQDQYADSIVSNHLNHLTDIFYNFKPDPDKIAFEERYNDDYRTLWECYSPETSEPATRWDNTFYSRQDFVGWTGLGPISMLIEDVLGLDISGKDNTISWTIKRRDKHGIKNILLRDQKVTLECEQKEGRPEISIKCERPFQLILNYQNKRIIRDINVKKKKIFL